LLGSALNEQGGVAEFIPHRARSGTGLRQAGKNFPPLKLPSNFCPPDWLSEKVWAGAE